MNIFGIIKSGSGYTWAALCLVVVLATFIGLNFWANTLAKDTGLQVSPRFSGGEVRQTIDHGSYKTLLHRIVFDGLVSERANGFVQIDWVPQEKQSLPAILREDLDIDGDGAVEVSVRVDPVTGKTELLRRAPWVLEPETLISADSERILRIQLRNPRK